MRRRSSTVTTLLAIIALFLLPAISNIEANVLPTSWTPFLWISWPAGVVLSAPLVYLEIRERHPVGGPGPKQDAASANEQLRLLAAASRHQWTAAASDRRLTHPGPLPIRWTRATVPVAGPVSATTGYPRFRPLPGLTAVTHCELGEGTQEELYQIYGGLPSGRMLLIGRPGAGKSSAAILLLLQALRHREQATPDDQARIPVPVLFTLHGWNPDRGESTTDWMASKLAETYPMFRGRTGRQAAEDLLATERVAAFLDGLDETPASIRPSILAALADAPFRVVLLSRTAEAVNAAQHILLTGAAAVELQAVQPTEAATYLLQSLVDPPPPPWKAIRHDLAEAARAGQPRSALSEALTTPLALSLLRDVYGATGPVDELLDDSRFSTAADIENHLLDQAIDAAYEHRPGRPKPRYTVTTARHTLRYIAVQLTEQRTSDLAWWHIPTWTTHRSRMITAAVATVLANETIWAPGLGLSLGLGLGLFAGLIFGIASFIGPLAGSVRGVPHTPRQITRLSYRNASHGLAYGLMSGLTGGLLASLLVGRVSGLSAGITSGFSVGLASGVAGVALRGITRRMEVAGSSLEPADAWRQDRNGLVLIPVLGLVVGLLVTLLVKLAPGLASGLASKLSVVILGGALVGLVLGLGYAVMAKRTSGTDVSSPGSATIDTSVALVHLAIRHRTPLRLITFLEDARSRHLLRTVGPIYQFRHASLQQRLAQPTAERVTNSHSS